MTIGKSVLLPIWDEIARLTPNGKSYGDNWRPTTTFWFAEFEKGRVSYGIVVD